MLGQLRVCFHKEQLTSLLRDIYQILSMLREFWWTGLHEILIAWLQSLKKRAGEVLEHIPLHKRVEPNKIQDLSGRLEKEAVEVDLCIGHRTTTGPVLATLLEATHVAHNQHGIEQLE
jgi:hypothetical protein